MSYFVLMDYCNKYRVLLYLHKTLSVFGLFAEIQVATKFATVQVKIHPRSSRVTRNKRTNRDYNTVSIRCCFFRNTIIELNTSLSILLKTRNCRLWSASGRPAAYCVDCCSITSSVTPDTESIETTVTCTGSTCETY